MGNLSDAAIAGVYLTKQGDLSDRTQQSVWWESLRGACEDAGLSLSDVDGLVMDGPEGVGSRELFAAANVAEQLGHPLRFHGRNTVGAASTGAALNLAAHAICNGIAEVVAVVLSVAGKGEGYQLDRDEVLKFLAISHGPYETVYGTTRVSDYAPFATRHMHEYGTTSDQLAEIAVTQRHGAVLHPLSVHGHRGEITVEDVVSSRMIAYPLHLLDCCSINQGGAAVVMTSAANVRAVGKHAPVVIVGYGEGHDHVDANAAASFTEFPGQKVAAETAFGIAGLTPEEIDVAGFSDHFTISVLIALEDAGFCNKGEGGSFVEGGALAIDGRLPTNTNGGFLSFSHAGRCGVITVIEIAEQLRDDAGPRQVKNAKLGFVGGIGGPETNQSAMILGRA